MANWTIPAVLTAYAVVVLAAAAYRGWAARRVHRWPAGDVPETWPFVSVIVPAWNERGTVENCLRLLRAVDYPAFEAIIVAGGPDGTFEAAREICRGDSRLRVTEQQPRGKNVALNDGVRMAGGEVIVFLDADSLVAPDWLRALVRPLRGSVQASTGKYFPLRRTLIALWGEMTRVLEYEVRGRVILQGSGSIAVRRAALEAAGEFPEGVYADDWDLDARLALLGADRAFAPGAMIRSERPATLGEWWTNELRWRRIHLLSLFRLRDSLLRDAGSVARGLYPYVAAWCGVTLSVLALTAQWAAPAELRQGIEWLWLAVVVYVMARELAAAVEMTAYTGEASWLRVGSVAPLLICAGWLACCLASVSTDRATVHFKGPRCRPAPEREVPADRSLGEVES